MVKSANQLWKESNTSLSFKDWLEREKSKGVFIPNKKYLAFEGVDTDASINNSSIKDTLNISKDRFEKELGIDKKPVIIKDNKLFGLNKNILIVSTLLIVGAIGYKIYQKRK
jgi:hypothetical protein